MNLDDLKAALEEFVSVELDENFCPGHGDTRRRITVRLVWTDPVNSSFCRERTVISESEIDIPGA